MVSLFNNNNNNFVITKPLEFSLCFDTYRHRIESVSGFTKLIVTFIGILFCVQRLKARFGNLEIALNLIYRKLRVRVSSNVLTN